MILSAGALMCDISWFEMLIIAVFTTMSMKFALGMKKVKRNAR